MIATPDPMDRKPLCTRHQLPQIVGKDGRFIGRCQSCMQEDSKRRTRKNKPRPTEEVIDFALYPELHEFIKNRAHLNCRSVSQEILFRLLTAMRSMQAGRKPRVDEGD